VASRSKCGKAIGFRDQALSIILNSNFFAENLKAISYFINIVTKLGRWLLPQ
jgi:hypothetical protein